MSNQKFIELFNYFNSFEILGTMRTDVLFKNFSFHLQSRYRHYYFRFYDINNERFEFSLFDFGGEDGTIRFSIDYSEIEYTERFQDLLRNILLIIIDRNGDDMSNNHFELSSLYAQFIHEADNKKV